MGSRRFWLKVADEESKCRNEVGVHAHLVTLPVFHGNISAKFKI